jgi:hypothetical protein
VSEQVDKLWNDLALPELYQGDAKAYQAAVLAQYQLYVEMADRVSQRRGLANTFFLTLNTAIFTLIGVLLTGSPQMAGYWLVFPLVGVLGQCAAWFYLVRSYRLLNSAKFEVVGVLEERLPASPFWREEWRKLGEGRDWRRYWPLSHIEEWIPILFATTYLAAGVITMVGH